MQKLFELVEHIGKWRVLVQTRDLVNGAVTGSKIAERVIDWFHIVEKAIRNEHIDDGAVDGRTLAEGAVDTQAMADGAVKAAKVGDGAVGWKKLDGELQQIIASAGQHGVALSNEWGDSTLIGLSQKMLSEALGNVHKDGNDFVSLQQQIDQIVSGGATVSLTVNPSTVFINRQCSITLKATTDSQASSIKIFENGVADPIATGSNKSLSYIDTTTPAGNIQYYAEFVISGLTKRYPTSGYVNVQAVYEIYTGAAATYGDATMAAEANPHAAGSFNKQITTADGDFLFIEVPDNFKLTKIVLVSTHDTDLEFTQIESTRAGYKAYKNSYARGAETCTYKFTIANA